MPINELFILCIGCLALAIGPAVGVSGRNGPRLSAAHEGFTMAVVLALCLLIVLPHLAHELGLVGLFWIVLGAVIPTILGKFQLRARWSAGVVLLFIAAHAVVDGAVMGIGVHHGSEVLPWAVIAHRIPFGFALFAWAMQVAQTREEAHRVVWLSVAILVVATALGFVGGGAVTAGLPGHMPHIVEAIVAGMLIAMVAGLWATKPGVCPGSAREQARWAGVGAIVGLVVALVPIILFGFTPNSVLSDAAKAFWVLLLETAPALLLGFALAGAVPYFLTGSTLSGLRRGNRFGQAVRGVAYGLPLPVCSCGVLPVYESLIRRGVPLAAALAFLVATPELGLDAVLLSLPLLGGPLTVARVVAAVVVALMVAWLVTATFAGRAESSVEHDQEIAHGSLAQRLVSGMRFGFVEIFDHTMPWILVGLVVAAFAEPLLAGGALQQIPAWLQVPMAAIVSVPLYVCASGATPIAALAIHKGLSSGAALAFLIAGPATNLTTFGILAKLHGRQMAFMFALIVAVLAMILGWSVDLIGVEAVPVDFTQEQREHDEVLGPLCSFVLLLLVVASVLRQGPRGFVKQITSPLHAH